MLNLKQRFDEYHQMNPHVYDLVKHYAMEAIMAGHKHYGMQSVIERIRWHSKIESTDPDFKINNNHAPFYARMFNAEFPQFGEFFRTRTQGAANDN